MKTSRKWIYGFLPVLITAILVIPACYLEETRMPISVQNEYYIIDSKSILESIAENKEDIYIPTGTSPELNSLAPNDPVNWTQSDYLKIADSLHKFVWNESLDNWKLNSMSFSVLCDDVQSGLQNAHFVLFNVVDSSNGGSRIVHDIIIDPESNSVTVQATKYAPVVMDWKTIDLTNIKISADDALQLAESNGGMNKRKANNLCDISIALIPDSAGYDGWQVRYYENPGILFEFQVDPTTGEFK